MFKAAESVSYELEPHEQFLATKGRGERAETFRVQVFRRWKTHKSGPILSAHGPKILKNGQEGSRTIGGSFGHRFTSCDVPLTDDLRAELEQVGFFDGVEMDV